MLRASQLPLPRRSKSIVASLFAYATACCLSIPLGGISPGWAQTITTANVLTQHNDNSRTGANLNETILTTANVKMSRFGKLRSIPVDGQIYAQPLYKSALSIQGRTRNVVFVATEHNSVYAFDADSGVQLWKVNLGTSAKTPNNYWGNRYGPYHDMYPEIGITSTPVIDPVTNTLYVVAFVQNNSTNPPTWHYYLHALDLITGADKTTFHSPVEIKAQVAGNGDGSANGVLVFDPPQHNQRPALGLVNGQIYIMFASHADTDPYHGWVMTYNASTLAQTGVWCDTPDGGEGGIWQAGQGVTVDSNGHVYLITGNGSSDVQFGGTGYSECFVRLGLPKNGMLPVLDWFMPSNYNDLNVFDDDLGSAGLLALPGTPYMVGGGKQGIIYVVDTSGKVTPNMGHFNASGDQVVQEFQAIFGAGTSHIHGTPIYYNSPVTGSTLYVWGENDFLRAYKFDTKSGLFNTTATLTSTMTAPVANAYGAMPGGFLSLSANGSKPGTAIIWATTPYNANANVATVTGIFHAFDAATLKELWNDKQNATRDDMGNFAKFAPPTVANGKVFIPSFGRINSPDGSGALLVYGLLPTPPPPPAKGTMISLSFAGGGPNGNPADLQPMESAGITPTTHWNNGPGTQGSVALIDDVGTATGASASWRSDSTWSLPIPEYGGDWRMMKGYLDTQGAGSTVTVTVSGLPTNITTGGYDVYVYTDGDNGGATRTGSYRIGSVTKTATDPAGANFAGSFTLAANSNGNCLKFTNVGGTGFTLRATPGPASDGTLRAPVNGIEIVSHAAKSFTKLTGTPFGSPGSWDGVSTFDKAFDGSPGTFFDGPPASNGNGLFTGIDLGAGKAKSVAKIRFYPRDGFTLRMVGGVFQGSNTADFSSGVTNLFVIGTEPPQGTWTETTAIGGTGTFRYLRYLSPNGGWGNVAEVEFYTSP